MLKNDGREREENIKRSKHSRKLKCKSCKTEILIDTDEVKESTYRVGNKVFVDCIECGNQVLLK